MWSESDQHELPELDSSDLIVERTCFVSWVHAHVWSIWGRRDSGTDPNFDPNSTHLLDRHLSKPAYDAAKRPRMLEHCMWEQ